MKCYYNSYCSLGAHKAAEAIPPSLSLLAGPREISLIVTQQWPELTKHRLGTSMLHVIKFRSSRLEIVEVKILEALFDINQIFVFSISCLHHFKTV